MTNLNAAQAFAHYESRIVHPSSQFNLTDTSPNPPPYDESRALRAPSNFNPTDIQPSSSPSPPYELKAVHTPTQFNPTDTNPSPSFSPESMTTLSPGDSGFASGGRSGGSGYGSGESRSSKSPLGFGFLQRLTEKRNVRGRVPSPYCRINADTPIISRRATAKT
jgi:hypothetical protein